MVEVKVESRMLPEGGGRSAALLNAGGRQVEVEVENRMLEGLGRSVELMDAGGRWVEVESESHTLLEGGG
eukprot:3844278-Pyramimonas_sp.AAC.1